MIVFFIDLSSDFVIYSYKNVFFMSIIKQINKTNIKTYNKYILQNTKIFKII